MKILLVQTSFLGDTVLSTPVIKGLQVLYPTAEIWMMTTGAAKDLVVRDPLLTGVITFDKGGAESGIVGLFKKAAELRKFGFDRAYALQRSYRTSLLLALARIKHRTGFKESRLSFLYHRVVSRNKDQHDVERNLSILEHEVLGVEVQKTLRLFAPEDSSASESVKSIVQSKTKYAVLVPGSVWATKRWSVTGYREVALDLLSRGLAVVLVGSSEDGPLTKMIASDNECLDLAGRTTIAELMLLIKNAQLLVCNDSMALHVGSAFKTPTVAVFCATSPTFGFGPWQNRAVVVEKQNLPCKPCSRHGEMRCPTATSLCMQGLSSREVLAAVDSLLTV